MDVRHLIDAVVQRTMVLIAQLATAEGGRAPLAHVADQVFLDLITELEHQGVRRKVVADMFGLALRSYQKRVQRVVEGVGDHGTSLRDAMLGWLQERNAVTRETLLARFRHEDEAVVKAILADLVDQGFVFRAGSAAQTVYRAASAGELDLHDDPHGEELASLVWLTIYRHGPITLDGLTERHRRLTFEELEPIVQALVSGGRVTAHDGPVTAYSARHYLPQTPADTPWAASVSDHFDALVTTLCRAIAKDPAHPWAAATGGSTYSFDLWPGHPFESQVLGLLKGWRGEISRLRADVTAFNDAHAAPVGAAPMRATLYFGENVVSQVADAFSDIPAAKEVSDA
ncbi:MAG: hypothetical protein U1F43_26950 [Myxococcota bacterium]